MGEVSVEINGRKFRMACEDDQEDHLTALAARFNIHVDQFKGSFGEIGDNRLTVMAGIAVLDELVEAERRIEQLEGEVTGISASREATIAEANALQVEVTKTLSDTARKIEAVSVAINETASGK